MQQQAPGPAQAGVDVVAAIEVGIVDHPLPAHGGARLLEIHPHHDLEVVAMAFLRLHDRLGVLAGSHPIVNGAGTHDHQLAPIAAMENRLDPLAGLLHGARRRLADRQLRVQHRRRHQGPGFNDMEIGGGDHGPANQLPGRHQNTLTACGHKGPGLGPSQLRPGSGLQPAPHLGHRTPPPPSRE